MTKVKLIAKKYGGVWKYVGPTPRWECEDGRVIQGCSRGVDEFDNPLPGGPVYYLYKPGKLLPAECLDNPFGASILELA